jgi:hypothetical protein
MKKKAVKRCRMACEWLFEDQRNLLSAFTAASRDLQRATERFLELLSL